MTIFDEIERDAKNGTPGKWKIGPFGDTQISGPEDSGVASAGGWSDSSIDITIQRGMQRSNARRIANVPRYERAIMAAKEVEVWLSAALISAAFKKGSDQEKAARAALAAFREATK